MKKINWKKLLNLVFLIAVFSVTMLIVFDGEDFGQVLDYIQTASLIYVIPSIVCVFLFIMGEGVIIWYLLRKLGVNASFYRCCLYSGIGYFYSSITPSASGGQPLQIVAMRKDRIPVAMSLSVLGIIAITYKVVLVALGAVILILRPAAVMDFIEPVEFLVYLGMTLNVVTIIVLLLLVFRPNIVRRFCHWVIRIVHKIRPFRNLQRQHDRIENLATQYQGAADFFRSHKGVILRVIFINALQRFSLLVVTWLTYRSFALEGSTFPQITSLQGMIHLSADMMPLPGGMGISETMFLDIFRPIFGDDLVLPGMVISRGISFYAQVLISAVMTIIASFTTKERRGRKKK